MTELICIGCPKGCHLVVDEGNQFAVTGAHCQKGIDYGREELQNPTRVVTSTVCIDGAIIARLPVKTNSPIPKNMVLEAVALLDDIKLAAPIQAGQIVVKNIFGTGVSFVATRSLL